MFCLFPGYERTSGGVVTKYYSFNGVNVAMRTGAAARSISTATACRARLHHQF
jgi:hypothetical protein